MAIKCVTKLNKIGKQFPVWVLAVRDTGHLLPAPSLVPPPVLAPPPLLVHLDCTDKRVWQCQLQPGKAE